MRETAEIRLTTLGLAVKAGKTVFGTEMVCEALKNKKVSAVIAASSVSENTAKRLSDRCAFYGVPLYFCSADTAELGRAVGKGPTAAVAICDASLAKAVTSTIRKS